MSIIKHYPRENVTNGHTLCRLEFLIVSKRYPWSQVACRDGPTRRPEVTQLTPSLLTLSAFAGEIRIQGILDLGWVMKLIYEVITIIII
jgi:hypothetical protein